MPAVRSPKRKEQSRSAAKSRRITETEVYTELANILPGVGQQTVYQSDRIGCLRVASMICRTRRLMNRLYSENPRNGVESDLDEDDISKCLDGFIMIVNKAGQMLYVSSGTSASIGFTQIDLVGKYIRDYVHHDDWFSLCRRLGPCSNPQSDTSIESCPNSAVFFRMKTAYTPRGGRARKLTMAVYQPLRAYVVDPSAKLINAPSFDCRSTSSDEDIRILFSIPFLLSPLQRPISSSVLSSCVATSRHEVDMKFKYCSDKLASALEHENGKQLINQSFFGFVYPEDVKHMVRDFQQLYKTSHVTTCYYRLSTKSGKYIWVMTEANLLVQNIRGVTQKSILCNHYVLSKPTSLGENIVNLKCDPVRVLKAPISTGLQRVCSVIKHAGRLNKDTLALSSPQIHHGPPGILAPVESVSSPIIDKYGLICSPTSLPKPIEFSSLLMSAVASPFPFPTPFTQPSSYPFATLPLVNFDSSPFARSILHTSADLNPFLLGSTSLPLSNWASAFTARVPSALSMDRRHRLDAKTVDTFQADTLMEGRKDEDHRKRRLDAKTIESFEVAMIKNELTVGD